MKRVREPYLPETVRQALASAKRLRGQLFRACNATTGTAVPDELRDLLADLHFDSTTMWTRLRDRALPLASPRCTNPKHQKQAQPAAVTTGESACPRCGGTGDEPGTPPGSDTCRRCGANPEHVESAPARTCATCDNRGLVDGAGMVCHEDATPDSTGGCARWSAKSGGGGNG